MRVAFTAAALLVTFAALTTPGEAQTGTARGRIVDTEGNGVAEATVRMELQGGTTRTYELTTNRNGEYIQVGLTPGAYRFIASKVGYQASFVDHRVTVGGATRVPEITLKTSDEVAKEEGRPTAELREKFTRAVELTNSNRLDEAEALFEEILEETPEIPEVHQNLGHIHAQREDWSSAEASYLKALELRPGDRDATTGLTLVYMESGQEQKAQELVNRAAGENPEDANAQFNRGVFLMNSGDSVAAVSAFEAALASDSTMADAHYYLGTVLVGLDRASEAVQHLKTYLSMDPDNEEWVATATGLIEALEK
jgi:tetratricopeptide (TPR) repeat protein